jgi:UDP-glucuronate 4-epimerase
LKKIIITGAAGFIGYHLSQRLLKEGYEIFGIDNLNSYYDPALKQARLVQLQVLNFKFQQLDLQNYKGLTKVFTDFRPDIVINLAAQAGVRYSLENPRSYIESNLDGFFNILEASRQHGVQNFIYASSSSVYGNNEKSPFAETDNVDHPVSLYAATKKSNELIAHTYSN